MGRSWQDSVRYLRAPPRDLSGISASISKDESSAAAPAMLWQEQCPTSDRIILRGVVAEVPRRIAEGQFSNHPRFYLAVRRAVSACTSSRRSCVIARLPRLPRRHFIAASFRLIAPKQSVLATQQKRGDTIALVRRSALDRHRLLGADSNQRPTRSD